MNRTMNLIELSDEAIRPAMIAEILSDQGTGRAHISPRLAPQGVADWPGLLLNAATTGTPASLAEAVRAGGRLRLVELRTRAGVTREADVPVNAADILGEGEFNRYYCRAVCIVAIVRGGPDAVVEVYRAKGVDESRPGSRQVVGTRPKAAVILEDLREHSNAEMQTTHGVPGGPNSGVSLRFVKPAPIPDTQ